ncbi:MAG: rRNA maturation RNase YbeY [Pseudobacteriovorax sp.]|nr:rRNA maturation RNase YbeY [Pseudobacteriovorax sp.]
MASDSSSDDPHISWNSRIAIDQAKVDNLLGRIKSHLGLDVFDVSISFVNNEDIQSLNSEFRNKNQPTDVLSFPQEHWPEPVTINTPYHSASKHTRSPEPPRHLGDIVIAPLVALDNANGIGQSIDREICFLIIHGILHLCGHDHNNPTEEIIMIEQQKTILSLLEEDDPPLIWSDCARLRS